MVWTTKIIIIIIIIIIFFLCKQHFIFSTQGFTTDEKGRKKMTLTNWCLFLNRSRRTKNATSTLFFISDRAYNHYIYITTKNAGICHEATVAVTIATWADSNMS